MSKVVSIIAFILIIGLVIFIHEFGHFLAAKRHKVGVVEFSIGLGPKLFSFVRKGTRYSVKWIPFGGYCMMQGDESFLAEGPLSEDPKSDRRTMKEKAVVQNTETGASAFDAEKASSEEAITVREAEEKETLPADHSTDIGDDEHAFNKKSVWVRIIVIAAGPVFNFLLALLLALLLIAMVGTTTTELGAVASDYPAEEAGLKAGDVITKLDHTSVHLFKDITLYMAMHSGEQMEVTFVRGNETKTTTLTPRYSEEDGRYLIGIMADDRQEHLNFGEVLKYGWYEFSYNTGVVIKSLGMLLTGKASFNDLSGPVGMAGMVNEIVEGVEEDTAGEPFWTKVYWILVNLISFTVLISANLGIMNLLPIPGLDGGRLIFLIIEAIRGKPVPKKHEGIVTAVGFALLLLLMVAVFFNDIRKVFF